MESERGTSGRAFQQRGVRVIANDLIRDGGLEPVGGPPRWNPEALQPWPSPILDGAPAAGLDDFDHDVGMKRSRSPGLERVGGPAVGASSRKADPPRRLHPPGPSTH